MTFHSLTEAKAQQKDIMHKLQRAIDQLEEESIYLLQKLDEMPEGKEKDDLLDNIQWHSDEIQTLLAKASNKYTSALQLDETMDELKKANQILSKLVNEGLD